MSTKQVKKDVQDIEDGDLINVEGYIYEVEIAPDGWCNEVDLIPQGSGSIAHSSTKYSDYAYTNGGKTFRQAVQVAKKIKNQIIEKRK